MKTHVVLKVGAALGLLSVMVSLPVPQALTQDNTSEVPMTIPDFVPPTVFQAAGPTAASIQSAVTAYRGALGENNNNNDAGPLPLTSGHREINWDGRDVVTNAPLFDGFLVSRGALFTTPDGTAFVQATPAGLAGQFNNPTYGTIFTAFSQPRLFSAIGGKITDVDFFVPGSSNIRATVTGFGAVFTDVDQPDGSGPGQKQGNRHASTLMEYFGAGGALLFSSFVPASPGDGSLSFFGIVFPDAR
ncbi:MAG: hypothetical protein L0312_08105, partial [Acidobacteria bacterium]|nr:hypothetical protein [Acidobacteriota bacterium]